MGRVEYSRLDLGTTSSTDADAIFTAIATETASVDAANIAEEGLDHSSVEEKIASTRAFDKVTETTLGTQAITTSYAVVNFGTAMTTSTVTVAANEVLFVQFGMEFLSDSTQEGVPAAGDVYVTLFYFPNGGAATEFADARQRIMPPAAGGRDGRVRCLLKLDGPLTLDYVRAEIKDDASSITVQLDSAVLSGRIYKRMS